MYIKLKTEKSSKIKLIKKVSFLFLAIVILLFFNTKEINALSCGFIDHKYYIEHQNNNVIGALKSKISYEKAFTADSCPNGKETFVELDNIEIAKEKFFNAVKNSNIDVAQLNSGIYEVICWDEDGLSCMNNGKLEGDIDNLEQLKEQVLNNQSKKDIIGPLLSIQSKLQYFSKDILDSIFNYSFLLFSLVLLCVTFLFFGFVFFYKKFKYFGFLLLLSVLMQILSLDFLAKKILNYQSYSLNKYAKKEILDSNHEALFVMQTLKYFILTIIFLQIVYYVYLKIKNLKNRKAEVMSLN